MVASIFYNQPTWQKLLCNFIDPFVKENQSKIAHWHLSLSTYRGAHINFVFQANQGNDLTEIFKISAQQYLENYPSAIQAIDYPLDTLFMDYPVNTVEYDNERLYPTTFDSSLFSIRQHLSEIIIQTLGEHEIDIESIFTLIVYLQFGIIKAGFTNTKTARINTLKLVLHLTTQSETPNPNQADEEKSKHFIALFEYNKDIFKEIIEEIWSDEPYSSELQWMTGWEDECKNYLQDREFHVVFLLLSQIAYQQAGLNSNGILLDASRQILKIFNQVTRTMEGIIRLA